MAAGTTLGRDVKALVAEDDPRDAITRVGPSRSSIPSVLPRTRSGIYAVASHAPVTFHVPPNPVPRFAELPTLEDEGDEDDEDTVPIRRLERVDLESIIERVSTAPPPPIDARALEVPRAPPERPSLRVPDPMASDAEEPLPWRYLGSGAMILLMAVVVTFVGRGAVAVVDHVRSTKTIDARAHLTSVHREATTMHTSAMPTRLFAHEPSPTPPVAASEPTAEVAEVPIAYVEPPFVGPPMLEPLPEDVPSELPSEESLPTTVDERGSTTESASATHARREVAVPPAGSGAEPAETPSGESDEGVTAEAGAVPPVETAPIVPVDPAAAALSARLDPPPRAAPLPELPPRAAVSYRLRALVPRVNACSTATSTLPVRLTFASDGSVTSVVVSNAEAGVTDVRCVEATLRTAHVPAFARGSFTTDYVYTRP